MLVLVTTLHDTNFKHYNSEVKGRQNKTERKNSPVELLPRWMGTSTASQHKHSQATFLLPTPLEVLGPAADRANFYSIAQELTKKWLKKPRKFSGPLKRSKKGCQQHANLPGANKIEEWRALYLLICNFPQRRAASYGSVPLFTFGSPQHRNQLCQWSLEKTENPWKTYNILYQYTKWSAQTTSKHFKLKSCKFEKYILGQQISWTKTVEHHEVSLVLQDSKAAHRFFLLLRASEILQSFHHTCWHQQSKMFVQLYSSFELGHDDMIPQACKFFYQLEQKKKPIQYLVIPLIIGSG